MAELLRRIIEAIAMQMDSNWMMKYYSPGAQPKIVERALRESGDPDALRTAALLKRHRELMAAFTGNDSEVEAGLKALYRDQANWPPEMKERMKEYGAE